MGTKASIVVETEVQASSLSNERLLELAREYAAKHPKCKHTIAKFPDILKNGIVKRRDDGTVVAAFLRLELLGRGDYKSWEITVKMTVLGELISADTNVERYEASRPPIEERTPDYTTDIQRSRETAKGGILNVHLPAGLVAATDAQKELIAKATTLLPGMSYQAAKRHLGTPTEETPGSLFYELAEDRVEGGYYVNATLTFDDVGLADVKLGFGHESRSPRIEE